MFVMGRRCGDLTDAMRGSLRAGPHGWDTVYTLNGELYRSQWVRERRRVETCLAGSGC